MIYDKLPNYNDIQLLNETMYTQSEQVNKSDYLNPSYLNVLNSRVQINL